MKESEIGVFGQRAEQIQILPRRPEFRRALFSAFKDGRVVILEPSQDRSEPVEWEAYEGEYHDIANAAQTIVIDYIESELIAHFERPELAVGRDEHFYKKFMDEYARYVWFREVDIWNELDMQTVARTKDMSDTDLDALSPTTAAYMSLAALGREEPPHSVELYGFLAKYAEAYEFLLKEKYGTEYSPEILYKELRAHMPAFMLKFIGMDSVMIDVLTPNMAPPGVIDTDRFVESVTPLDTRALEIREGGGLGFKQTYVDEVHAHVRKSGVASDPQGRTVNRGCPVLFSKERDKIVDFAINELIEQHKIYQTSLDGKGTTDRGR